MSLKNVSIYNFLWLCDCKMSLEPLPVGPYHCGQPNSIFPSLVYHIWIKVSCLLVCLRCVWYVFCIPQINKSSSWEPGWWASWVLSGSDDFFRKILCFFFCIDLNVIVPNLSSPLGEKAIEVREQMAFIPVSSSCKNWVNNGGETWKGHVLVCTDLNSVVTHHKLKEEKPKAPVVVKGTWPTLQTWEAASFSRISRALLS